MNSILNIKYLIIEVKVLLKFNIILLIKIIYNLLYF